ncbi:MAG: hypothetical protein FWH56_02170 [Betaproteobacteria bacterium]|nr:hypothetical protein [Betaproteobacteria bacterium]
MAKSFLKVVQVRRLPVCAPEQPEQHGRQCRQPKQVVGKKEQTLKQRHRAVAQVQRENKYKVSAREKARNENFALALSVCPVYPGLSNIRESRERQERAIINLSSYALCSRV